MGSPNNLWCYGVPGSGKTVLASIAVDDLRQKASMRDRIGIAVIYCEWKRRELSSATNLLASLWQQISRSKPLSKEIKDLYKRHDQFSTLATYDEVRLILKREIESLSSVYIVIDALDELNDENSWAGSLASALHEFTQSSATRMHILATSRSQQSSLEDHSLLEITAKGEDIELFATHAISQGLCSSRALSDKIRTDDQISERILLRIRQKARGLFLLARLFIQSLRQKTNIRDLLDAVESAPSSINDFYAETLERIKQQNPDHRKLAWRLLSWIAHAVRPLTTQELRHALAVRQGDETIDIERLDAEDLFVVCCHGLVAIEKATQCIRLVHYTVQQYLDDHQEELFPNAQADIFRTCMTYISFKEFHQGRCSFETFDPAKFNEVANGKRIAKKRFLPNRLANFPFFRYAASSWG
ncbi:MAG: hypothetical protein Q9222_001614 [Ikaeria aurantiellina]